MTRIGAITVKDGLGAMFPREWLLYVADGGVEDAADGSFVLASFKWERLVGRVNENEFIGVKYRRTA